MSGSSKKYWKGIEELENHPEFVKNANKEFQDYLPILNKNEETGATHRRDFLKILGFGVAAVSLAACDTPVKKAIPYAIKPEEVDPGVANWYASSFVDGADYASVLVKTREGRPIKIEGNKFSSISQGGTSVKAQASVLSLYDEHRYKQPKDAGKDSKWEIVNAKVSKSLEEISSKGGKIRLVTPSVASPSSQAVINDFIGKYGAKHIVYDSISYAGIIKANQKSFGKAVIPSYDFTKANVIVSIGADFLCTWLSADQYAKQYAANRRLNSKHKVMNRHYQFETTLSLSGANADFRKPVKPSQLGLVATTLYKLLGGSGEESLKFPELSKAAKELLDNRGSSLVVSGSNDPEVQIVVNAINDFLGNYGKTIDLSKPNNLVQGNDSDFNELVDELKAGDVSAVLFYNVNPVYNHIRSAEVKDGIKKAELSVALAYAEDETSSLTQYVLPTNHYLESWNDFQPTEGYYSLQQPTITNIFDTKQFEESLLALAGKDTDYYEYIRGVWNSTLFNTQSTYSNFDDFWNRSVHNGVYENPRSNSGDAQFSADVSSAIATISSNYKVDSKKTELAIYVKSAIGDGSQANNPWLQELPDPITKATWDNYITIAPSDAKAKGITNVQGNTVYGVLKIGSKTAKLPILIQPGQALGTYGIALGYGRTVSGKVARERNEERGIGVNAFEFTSIVNGTISYSVAEVDLEVTPELRQIAHTQIHQTIMGRNIVQDTTLSKYKKVENVREHDESYQKTIVTSEGKERAGSISLWNRADWKSKYNNHFWGMVIDLNTCLGCSACVVSCNAENNVPVVGRDEVSNARDMHWLRIDRYYSSVEDHKERDDRDKKLMENPEDNPRVVFQPMLCQHCNNAPCETVCPVLATTHSTEGLNQMTYNRCVGTRYCANNCPYKVRRFNWFAYVENENFDYYMNNSLGKMVLNPDVTVRARGVMEKCSMCVQRIQEGKLTAKKEGRRPADGEIETACSQSCPTDAITFGDMNDPSSRISKLIADEKEGRLFQVLEEINTRPSLYYLSKVRNID